MRKLRTTDVTNSAAMPMKSGSLEHIQLAYYEALRHLSLSTIIPANQFSAGIGYKLWGCENSGTGSNYIISEGAIFFDGEIYSVDAVTFTISGSNVAVGVITTTSYTGNGVNADPVNFTDGNQYNIHEIRKIVFQAGLSGSGAFNYNNAFDMRAKPQGCIGQVVTIGLDTADVSSNFDGTGLGTSERFKGWAIANGNNGTYPLSGRTVIQYNPSDGDFNTIGAGGGEKTHTLSITEIPSHSHNVVLPATTGTPSTGGITFSGVHNADVTLTSTSTGGGAAHNNLQPYIVMLMITRIY